MRVVPFWSSLSKLLDIALVNPEIPPNTGNIARLCAAFQLHLHLVKPLGFATDDRTLKRAGLDYWPHVKLTYHEDTEAFLNALSQRRLFFFTTKAQQSYLDVCYQANDCLVFGSETSGLDAALLKRYWDRAITIPMFGPVRSLNLSSAVAMATGEALRQLGG